ncbi:MAG: DUF2628 domain-containing protein [Methylobacteriaceae bacterium]|nr:DUF2628 domain-containing protein [Methylobacteriaceae bacterium]MBV9703306.1 DUF2628 domain-containing protein [Methylobacteriaceae bacterium]
MAIFTVHLPTGTGNRFADAERAIFVPEAFSWGAMILGPLWLAGNRAWLGLLGWLALVAALGFAARWAGLPSATANMGFLLVAIFFGLEGRQLVRFALERRGYRLADVVSAPTRRDAEQAFFARWLASATVQPATTRTGPQGLAGNDVIGLFPQPGGRP